MSRMADYAIGIQEDVAKVGQNLLDNADLLSENPELFELELILAIDTLQNALAGISNPQAQFDCIYCGEQFSKDKGKAFRSNFQSQPAFTCFPCE